jgi:hypothetical protein
MGLPPEFVAKLIAAEPKGFQVWPVNMPVIDAWNEIETQWRTQALADGRVHWIGLDYAAVRAGYDMAGAVIEPRIWAGVRLMERTASVVLNGVG